MIGFDQYLHRCACARQTGNGPLTASGGGGGKIWRSTLWRNSAHETCLMGRAHETAPIADQQNRGRNSEAQGGERGSPMNTRPKSQNNCDRRLAVAPLCGAPLWNNPRALSHETCLTGALPMGADPQLFNIWRAVGGFVLHFKHVRGRLDECRRTAPAPMRPVSWALSHGRRGSPPVLAF